MTMLKQSTVRTILVGPVLDADGAAKTDEVVANIRVTKNGTVGSADGSATLTHDHAGKYKLALTANDVDTLGVLEISLTSGTNDMPVRGFNVVPANVFDSLVSGDDYLDISLKDILGTALTESVGGYIAAAVKKLFDVATPLLVASDVMRGTDGANTTVPDAAGVVATALGLLETHGDSTWATATDVTVSDKTGFSLSATGANLILKDSTFALAIADAVWDELLAGHTTADTAGLVLNEWQDDGRLDLLLDAIPTTAMRGTDGANTTVPDAAGVVATALGTLQTHGDGTWATATGFAEAGDQMALTDAQVTALVNASRDAILNRVLAGNHDTAGTPGKVLQDVAVAGDKMDLLDTIMEDV